MLKHVPVGVLNTPLVFWCCACAGAAFSLFIPEVAFGKDDLATVKSRAAAAVRAAAEAIPRARGSGTFTRKRLKIAGAKYEEVSSESGTFTMAYSGKRDFIKLQFEAPCAVSDPHAQIYINDGGALLEATFTPRALPKGGNGYVHPLYDEGGLIDMNGVSPHVLVEAWSFFDRIDTLYKSADPLVTLAEDAELHTIKIETPKAGKTQFTVDPQRNYHLTRYLAVFPEGKECRRIEKDWAKTSGGLWYVKKYADRFCQTRDDNVAISFELEFSSFEPNIEIPEDLFSIDCLGLPPGTSVLDYRTTPNERKIVKSPKTELAVLESVVGEFPRLIVAGDPDFEARAVEEAEAAFKKGDDECAIRIYTILAPVSSDRAMPFKGRGRALARKGEYEKAIADFKDSLRHFDGDFEVHNQVAWLLATCPLAALRNGDEAVQHAEKACELSELKDPDCFSTLAAAFAETGDFTQAVKAQSKAIALLPDRDRPTLEKRLELYRARKPFRIDSKK